MEITKEVQDHFPGICVAEGDIRSVRIVQESPRLEALKRAVTEEIRARYSLETVRNEPVFRAYRDFFWSVGIDPTKTRPASEALVRRVLGGKTLPAINNAVDAYNLASAASGIPIAAFDIDLLEGDLTLRFARRNELFLGIGMNKQVAFEENQVIMTDEKEIIAIYPYRDSDATKVTPITKNIRIVACGIPKIERDRVLEAYQRCARYLEEYAHGIPSGPSLFPRESLNE